MTAEQQAKLALPHSQTVHHRLRARAVRSRSPYPSGCVATRSVNVYRTLGAHLVRFGVPSRALFCTILPSAFFPRVGKALVYWAFSGAAGKD
jgi:hypothetical protein